jgi:exodeoxyribonuclease V beta subunit
VDVGTFVHRVLEAIDFSAPDLDAELTAAMAEVQARRPVELGDPAAVVAGLRAAIETPLLDGLRLRDLARADRLDELDFELPLVGGDQPSGELDLDAIASVLRAHGGALAGYADRLGDPALRRSVRGYVTGSIDLVARAGDRFLVVDYKTNWLGGPGEELTAWHYRREALEAEMLRGHYGLQALLYTVALHRYLRWRLAGYDPDRHLAGVLYLFVRGMTGTGSSGVFSWQPSGELVSALSDVLETGAP